jgi:hypothetical protein
MLWNVLIAPAESPSGFYFAHPVLVPLSWFLSFLLTPVLFYSVPDFPWPIPAAGVGKHSRSTAHCWVTAREWSWTWCGAEIGAKIGALVEVAVVSLWLFVEGKGWRAVSGVWGPEATQQPGTTSASCIIIQTLFISAPKRHGFWWVHGPVFLLTKALSRRLPCRELSP